jgi:hypothetical protein
VLGKSQSINFPELLNSKDVLKLDLNPSDILIPSKYQGSHDYGYDIALIGLSKSDK